MSIRSTSEARTGKAWNCPGNSLKSSGLQQSIKGRNAREMEPQLC